MAKRNGNYQDFLEQNLDVMIGLLLKVSQAIIGNSR
jgi:hypothetical protein